MLKYLCTAALLLSQNIVLAADKDNDGVMDELDMCPDTAQIKKVDENFTYAITVNPERLKPGKHSYPVMENGCEADDDKDGVVNSRDYCPQDSSLAISKGIADNGCPIHSDYDGTPDYRDKCPNTPKGVKTDHYGCEKKNKTAINHLLTVPLESKLT